LGVVNVDDLKEGMVLSRDLIDARGRFLLGKGTVLEDKHLRIMKIWGITAANIDGISQEEIALKSLRQYDPAILNEAQSYVDSLFCTSEESHNAMDELKRLCLLRIAGKIKSGIPLPRYRGNENIKQPDESIVSIQHMVDKNVQLSSFPDIYQHIVQVINNPRSSASRVAEVVSKDTSLTATLLKLVNSAFYGLPTKVDSITRAIALIGGKELSTLALGISVIRYFKDIPPRLINMKHFWMHSIACGIFARILANRKMELSEEQFFLGGLLHDIGSLVMLKEYPLTMAYIIDLSHQRKHAIYQVEQEVLGYDQAEVAGMLLEKWNFPPQLIQMIRHQNSPKKARSPLEPAIILIASIMATVFWYGDSGSRYAPPVTKDTWDSLGLPPSVFESAIKQADRQVNEILNAFHVIGEYED